MRRSLAWLAALITFGACAAVPLDSESACVAQATLAPNGQGLAANYELCAPVATFAFEQYNKPQRTEGWTAPSGWSFDGETLRREDGAAFDQFTLQLAPEPTFHDRRYVAVDRVGAGWTLLLSAMRPAGGALALRFTNFPRDAVVYRDGAEARAARAVVQIEADESRVAYVGPASNIRRGALTTIAGDDVPAWLVDQLIADVNDVRVRMTARMGRAPPSPTLIVTHQSTGRGFSSKGGVLDGYVVEIRLRGTIPAQEDEAMAADITNLAAHEAVHLWIGHLWLAARNDEEPWLHEGGAEYLGSRLTQDASGMRAEAEERLNKCLLRDNGAPLDGSEGPVHGLAPYDCGFVLMLAAEAASLRAGRGDIFSLWRAVLEQAGPEGFTPMAFLEEARARGGEAFEDAASAILAPLGDDATDIGGRLTTLGIAAAPRPMEAYMAHERALMPVLHQLCASTRLFGFSTTPDRIIFDTEQTCGAQLAGNPEVIRVEGVDLIREPGGAHAAVRSVCAAGGMLRFETPAGGTLPPVPCSAEIAPLPQLYAISALPPLP